MNSFIGRGPRARSLLLTLSLGAAAALGGATACGGDEKSQEEEAAEVAAACGDAREYFAREAWTNLMGVVCIDCHSPSGIAVERGADFQLLPAGYPGFLDANFEEVRRVAQVEIDGQPQMRVKPTGQVEHGGGVVVAEGSHELEVLDELLTRLRTLDQCPDVVTPAQMPEVELLGPAATLRKAALHLTGRLPTPAETEAVVSGGEQALAEAITALMGDEAFYVRLEEIYNDVFLTDRYLGYNGYALNILNDADFPIAGSYYDDLPDDVRSQVNVAVAREPLALISHVVRNGRPFTEILTAGYTVMNDASAPVYNAAEPSPDYTEGEFREEQITVVREEGELEWPHAGILTSPMFLNRYPTTQTNRNRHRARMIYEFFLATDILEIGERPIDPTQSAKYINPTRDDPSCNHCHRLIDPIAGAFLRFDDNDQEELRPDRAWFPEMFPPGFGDEVMEVTDFDNAPQWLAQRIVADPRFALSVVYTMYQALVGAEPMAYPGDTSRPDYGADIAAWEAQEAAFRGITSAFVESDYDLKVVIREIVLGPYFRAVNASSGLGADAVAQLSQVGTARLSTPELLARRVQATTGVPWARGYDGRSLLDSDYEILYGGIDSDIVVDRLTVPNGVMAAVQWRMANEVACTATAWDFYLPKGDRFLFRQVDPGDTPVNAEDAIKQNIQYLHGQLLGEDLALDDPELLRTYDLFQATWSEGSDGIFDETISGSLPWDCRARRNPLTREDLPDDVRINDDENYVIRSWMAVVTYLLSDFKFLYE